MDDATPNQLYPLLYFVAAADDRTRAHDYYSSYLQHLGLENPSSFVDETLPEKIVGPGFFDLADTATALASLPAGVADKIRGAEAVLLRTVSSMFYVPAGFELESEFVTLLAAANGAFAKDTVVYVQRFRDLQVLYVFPRVTMSLTTGDSAVHDLHPDLLAAAAAPRPAVGIDVDELERLIDAGLQLGSSLAWALPPPWGAVVSTVLKFFEMLFGALQPSQPNPLTLAVEALENFMREEEVNEWVGVVQNFIGGTNGLNTHLEAMKETSLDSDIGVMQTIIHIIDDAVEPGNSTNLYAATDALYGMTSKLVAQAKQQTPQQYYDAHGLPMEQMIDLTNLAVSTFLVALKIRVQLYATIASISKQAANDEMFNDNTSMWLDQYAIFEMNVNGGGKNQPGWTARILSLLAEAEPVRLGLVGQPFRQIVYPYKGTGGGAWLFVDAQSEDPAMASASRIIATKPGLPLHVVYDKPGSGGCCNSGIQQKNVLVAHRNAYLASIGERFANRKKTVNSWATAVSEWSQHRPPPVPKQSPSIGAQASWAAATPQGANWVSGNAVSYAIAFVNASGPSPESEWSQSYPVTDKAFPTVTVPVDPLGMATARWVYRRFAHAPGESETVKIIGDNTTTSFVDKVP